MQFATRTVLILGILFIAGCHAHKYPPAGKGGFAEWKWPQITTEDTWHAENIYPDKMPSVFRVAHLRLKHLREGCAHLYFPAFITQAEEQWNKAIRAFAGTLYDDAYSDLRQLNLRLDEIDRRMEIAYGPRGSWQAQGCQSTDPTFDCAPCGCSPTLAKHGCSVWGVAGHCAGGCISGTGPGGCTDEGCTMRRARYGCSWQRQPKCNPCDKNAERRCANCGCGPRVVINSGPGLGLEDLGKDFPLTFSANLFDFDKDIVKPAFENYLVEIARRFRSHPDAGFVLYGHTDSFGSNPYNDDLALRRAFAVRRILLREGIPDSRIKVRGYGETRPLNDNSTGVLRALNRRVEIYLADFQPYRNVNAAKRHTTPGRSPDQTLSGTSQGNIYPHIDRLPGSSPELP